MFEYIGWSLKNIQCCLIFLSTGTYLCRNHVRKTKTVVFVQNFMLDDQNSNNQDLFKNNFNDNLAYSQSIEKEQS